MTRRSWKWCFVIDLLTNRGPSCAISAQARPRHLRKTVAPNAFEPCFRKHSFWQPPFLSCMLRKWLRRIVRRPAQTQFVEIWTCYKPWNGSCHGAWVYSQMGLSKSHITIYFDPCYVLHKFVKKKMYKLRWVKQKTKCKTWEGVERPKNVNCERVLCPWGWGRVWVPIGHQNPPPPSPLWASNKVFF